MSCDCCCLRFLITTTVNFFTVLPLGIVIAVVYRGVQAIFVFDAPVEHDGTRLLCRNSLESWMVGLFETWSKH